MAAASFNSSSVNHAFTNQYDSDWYLRKNSAEGSLPFERLDLTIVKEIFRLLGQYQYHVGGLYLVTIFGLQAWMKNRPAYDLRVPLNIWNSILGIFSILGFIRFIPTIVDVFGRENGFYDSICVPDGATQTNVFWTMLFVVSKVWELGDTIFIVLRKRPLVFLQWYHHVGTLVVTWTVASYMEPIVRWFVVINYFVHALMYPYFVLKSIGINIPRIIATSITSLQFVQMIIGLGVNLASFYLQRTGHYCYRESSSFYAFFILYGSFIFLFGNLLYDSIKRTKSVRNKKQA